MTFKELFALKSLKDAKGALVNELGFNSIEEIEKAGYKFHHSAIRKGYQSRYYSFADLYDGQFGKGIVVKSNNGQSTQYGVLISYYIKG